MIFTLNRVQLIGRLGKDAEIAEVGGTSLAKFSLATTRSWKDKSTQEWKKESDWHNCVAWGLKDSHLLTKGALVYVEGSLRTRSYEDKSGTKKYVTEITVDKFGLMDTSGNGGGGNGHNGSQVDEDCPF